MDRAIIADESQEKPNYKGAADFFLIASGLILLALAVLAGLIMATRPRGTAVSPDAVSLQPAADPIQSNVRGAAAEPIVWVENGTTWTIQPQAAYQIAGRVLGNKRYSDWESDAVPRDLAMGWGDISDPAVDEWINWRQSGRWYFYTWNDESPYDSRYIKTHSANVHIIPATENLDKALREVGKNDLIFMEGLLVNIEALKSDQSRSVQTSLTRSDSGNGACEILYVERLVWDGHMYE